MRMLIASAAAATVLLVSNAFAQQACLQPKWTECVSMPNGGRHTGTDPYDKKVEIAIPPASEVCVRNEWEIRAESYVQFSRNGVPWPHPDWEVRIEDFCLFKN
jgi:hypothetical protein